MKKTNNLIFILIFIIFSISILILNITMHPLNTKVCDISALNRDLFYPVINSNKYNKFDSVMIGGSGVTSALQVKQPNMSLNPQGISPIELYDLLKYFLDNHPEVKKIYVSLEFNLYFKCFDKYTIPRKPTNAFQDYIKLYFSVDATIKSLKLLLYKIFNISEKIAVNSGVDENNEVYFISLPGYKMHYDSICEYDNIDVFKKIYKLIQEHNLQAYYLIPPVSALYLSEAYNENYYKNIERFKKEIANITPFYDMSFINYYTSFPVGYLFLDPYHINGDFVSKKIFNIIYGRENDSTFAVYITKNNVDDVLKQQHQLLMEYISNNKELTDKYFKSGDIGKTKTTYLKDFPKNLQDMYYDNQNNL